MLTLFYIYMRYRGEVTVVLREVRADEVDNLVSALNLLSDNGEIYYKKPVTVGIN
ncbi:hypothetical protein RYH73_17630 [Olivibacter sp. CPCC 100613]|uniref:hypothetical protein n=1 Tax=Olivibacter sp. CPCC 100613 TaxID=3079931 RepID=UPI002FFBC11E